MADSQELIAMPQKRSRLRLAVALAALGVGGLGIWQGCAYVLDRDFRRMASEPAFDAFSTQAGWRVRSESRVRNPRLGGGTGHPSITRYWEAPVPPAEARSTVRRQFDPIYGPPQHVDDTGSFLFWLSRDRESRIGVVLGSGGAPIEVQVTIEDL